MKKRDFFFFSFFLEERGGCASGRFRASGISSRMEIAWEIVVLKHSRVYRGQRRLSLSLFLYDWSSVKMDLKEEGGVLTSFVIEYL